MLAEEIPCDKNFNPNSCHCYATSILLWVNTMAFSPARWIKTKNVALPTVRNASRCQLRVTKVHLLQETSIHSEEGNLSCPSQVCVSKSRRAGVGDHCSTRAAKFFLSLKVEREKFLLILFLHKNSSAELLEFQLNSKIHYLSQWKLNVVLTHIIQGSSQSRDGW